MAPNDGEVSLEHLTDADFNGRIGEPFLVRTPAGATLGAVLLEVTPHPHLPPTPGRRRGFSIVFRVAEPGHRPQGIYRVEHPALGALQVFLVPIGPRDGGMGYEAVFN